jgi:transcriptional regulator with XRE-family HTH domain
VRSVILAGLRAGVAEKGGAEMVKLNYTKFGDLCFRLRRERSCSMGFFAAAIGFDEEYVSSVERGEFQPSDSYVEAVAQFFALKLSYVWSMINEPIKIEVSPAKEIPEDQLADTKSNVISLKDFKGGKWHETSTTPTD